MEIRLDRVVDEPFTWQETLKLSGDELDHPEVVEFGEIACRGHVRPIASDFLLEASLSYSQTLRCMRCLEGFEMPVASDVSLLIQLREPRPEEGEIELGEKDLEILFLQEPKLDTRPIVIEQVHLEVPMKPLCRKDCAGLCAECGKNLNPGPCGCEPASDPRWGALASLKR